MLQRFHQAWVKHIRPRARGWGTIRLFSSHLRRRLKAVGANRGLQPPHTYSQQRLRCPRLVCSMDVLKPTFPPRTCCPSDTSAAEVCQGRTAGGQHRHRDTPQLPIPPRTSAGQRDSAPHCGTSASPSMELPLERQPAYPSRNRSPSRAHLPPPPPLSKMLRQPEPSPHLQRLQRPPGG